MFQERNWEEDLWLSESYDLEGEFNFPNWYNMVAFPVGEKL